MSFRIGPLFDPLPQRKNGQRYVNSVYCMGLANRQVTTVKAILKVDGEGRVLHCVFKCVGGCPFLNDEKCVVGKSVEDAQDGNV